MVMRKAWMACQNNSHNPYNHSVKITEMINMGKDAEKEAKTWLTSRYVYYLAVQNANSSEPIVAQTQTYFAIQRRWERTSRWMAEPRRRLAAR